LVDPHARGAFLGLTPETTTAALYRAVLEGLALQSRVMLDGMAALDGIDEPQALRLIGGVSRNRLFAQIKANVFGRPLSVVEEPEATALGAALLGGIAAGIYPNLDAALAGLRSRETTIEPNHERERYEALRVMVFERIHERIEPLNRQISAFNDSAK
jgi:xylulokinase